MKILLVLIDGMRPDALADIPQAQRMMTESTYSLDVRTVMPSVTLPCHMSLFHSVDPDRHGITTNTYTPQVRPIAGLCEQLKAAGKQCAFFYNWHQLRDLCRPGSLSYECFASGKLHTWEKSNRMLTDAAMAHIAEYAPDFVFLYLGWVDEAGHGYGWMGEEYMRAVQSSWDDIQRITASLPEEYTVIVTADHGGHGRSHGTDCAEDMTIPLFLKGTPFTAGKVLEGANIKDIAPTVAALLGAEPAPEWEGRNLL